MLINRARPKILLMLMILLMNSLSAATLQVPEWYRLKVWLDQPPQLNQPVELKAELSAIIGNLKQVQLRLILPENWQAEPETAELASLAPGNSRQLSFKITPGSCLVQGSIVVEASLEVPKAELTAHILRTLPDTGLEKTVQGWPAHTKRYADVSFALLPEESFYPMASDMWASYDDRLIASEGFRGPVYYEDPVLSVHQAQNDIEMFSKLEEYVRADPALLETMQQSGIDVNSKRYDQLNGFYLLAVKAYQDNSLDMAASFIDQFEAAISSEPPATCENLRIAAGNLKGLIYWGKGQRRLAEEAFKKVFYSNRKHLLQRYILRNIGLLMLAGKDLSTASEMFRLAKGFKSSYTLLNHESELLTKSR